ncbi:hypothetical protein IFM89_036599, partial [Coptis chinensis]
DYTDALDHLPTYGMVGFLSKDILPSVRQVKVSGLIGSSKINPLDVLVIGGGATGCGIALDAVTRGVHYLENAVFNFDYGQLKLVFHAHEERKQVIQNAPHLCHALPCMTPCFNWFDVVYYCMGLKKYNPVAVGASILNHAEVFSFLKDDDSKRIVGAHDPR